MYYTITRRENGIKLFKEGIKCKLTHKKVAAVHCTVILYIVVHFKAILVLTKGPRLIIKTTIFNPKCAEFLKKNVAVEYIDQSIQANNRLCSGKSKQIVWFYWTALNNVM